MDKLQKQKQYGQKVASELGKLVGKMKTEGIAEGLTKDEVIEVWKTTFSILSKKLYCTSCGHVEAQGGTHCEQCSIEMTSRIAG